ncbi:MAG: TrmH family RNA methyltransferase [Microcoleaceae cyanobacterium]
MDKPKTQEELIDYLSQFVTELRNQKINDILQKRTRKITVILEDIYQPHNASACLRSCDSFGIQDVHIIENRNQFNLNPDVSVGSDRWLTLYRYNQKKSNNTQTCIHRLKSLGYRIVATTPHEREITLDQISVKQKIALIFGTELNGISDVARSEADILARIPMFGFSESFNISVSVALCLYDVTQRLRQQTTDWPLNLEEQQQIRLDWLRQSIRGVKLIEDRFINL